MLESDIFLNIGPIIYDLPWKEVGYAGQSLLMF